MEVRNHHYDFRDLHNDDRTFKFHLHTNGVEICREVFLILVRKCSPLGFSFRRGGGRVSDFSTTARFSSNSCTNPHLLYRICEEGREY